jgi:hypothetical protein
MHQIEITESDESTASEGRPPPALPPETFRARGQTGLDQFSVEPVIDLENGVGQDT